MLKNGLTIFFLIATVGCSPKSSHVDCSYLENLLERDQYYRKDVNAFPVLYIADSLYRQDHAESTNEEIPSKYLKRAGIIARQNPNEDFVDISYSDSIINLMHKRDRVLTEELIDYIEHSSHLPLDTSYCFSQSLIVFVHTAEELQPRVLELLERNRAKIPKGMYRHIVSTYKTR